MCHEPVSHPKQKKNSAHWILLFGCLPSDWGSFQWLSSKTHRAPPPPSPQCVHPHPSFIQQQLPHSLTGLAVLSVRWDSLWQSDITTVFNHWEERKLVHVLTVCCLFSFKILSQMSTSRLKDPSPILRPWTGYKMTSSIDRWVMSYLHLAWLCIIVFFFWSTVQILR